MPFPKRPTERRSSLALLIAGGVALAAALSASCGSTAIQASPPAPDPTTPAGSATATEPVVEAAAPVVPRTTDLHYKTFGKATDRAIVFLHGGPGSNSVLFETLAAEPLAARGNFVVTYDQRGSGRSPKGTISDFTFTKVTQDLDDLIVALKLKSPTLLAHSWGGTLAVKYMELHPGVVAGAVIVGNPIDYPRSIANIHDRCTTRYQQRAQFAALDDVKQLHARMFPNGVKPPYQFTTADAGATMKHATDCGLNLPQFPSLGATALYATLLASPQYDLATSVAHEPLEGLQANERLLYSEFGAQFINAAPKLYGIYGDEDGLESEADLARISNLISAAHFKLIRGASHNVFVDQQPEFLDTLTADLDAM